MLLWPPSPILFSAKSNIDKGGGGGGLSHCSYHESENHRKNMKRLRSACVQGFGTHFLYNYLINFYQNEVIIEKQLETLQRGLQSGMKIVRDRFMRFVYVPANPIT